MLPRCIVCRRKLLNPIYSEASDFVGPETPTFGYRNTPKAAAVTSETNVSMSCHATSTHMCSFNFGDFRLQLLPTVFEALPQQFPSATDDCDEEARKLTADDAHGAAAPQVLSEKPYVNYEEKQGAIYQGTGSTEVQTWEGATATHTTGKGGINFKFAGGKRAFEVVHKDRHAVNVPQTNVEVGGGQPIAVSHKHAFAYTPNSTAVFASGNGPVYTTGTNVTVNPGMFSHGR